jgi:hypothetical protein
MTYFTESDFVPSVRPSAAFTQWDSSCCSNAYSGVNTLCVWQCSLSSPWKSHPVLWHISVVTLLNIIKYIRLFYGNQKLQISKT